MANAPRNSTRQAHGRIVEQASAIRSATVVLSTIATVLAAEMPILDVLCPGCQTVDRVDIRKLKRYPEMAISGLIPSLSCRFCCNNPPFAKLVGLRKAERRW
jgi:hypothetical protein